ncbi:MAG: hypothetical protein WA021_02505 [Minisyncoccia bacterium]
MDKGQLELLDAATNRVTYDDAVKHIKHNVAFRQRLPLLAERARQATEELRKMGGITA